MIVIVIKEWNVSFDISTNQNTKQRQVMDPHSSIMLSKSYLQVLNLNPLEH